MCLYKEVTGVHDCLSSEKATDVHDCAFSKDVTEVDDCVSSTGHCTNHTCTSSCAIFLEYAYTTHSDTEHNGGGPMGRINCLR